MTDILSLARTLLRRLRRRVPDDGYLRKIQHADPWPALLADPEFLAGIERGKADIAAGRVYVQDGHGGWKKADSWPKDDAA